MSSNTRKRQTPMYVLEYRRQQPLNTLPTLLDDFLLHLLHSLHRLIVESFCETLHSIVNLIDLFIVVPSNSLLQFREKGSDEWVPTMLD